VQQSLLKLNFQEKNRLLRRIIWGQKNSINPKRRLFNFNGLKSISFMDRLPNQLEQDGRGFTKDAVE
jgi:hypothetical protein